MNFPSFKLLIILILTFECTYNLPILQDNSIILIIISISTILTTCTLWFILKKEDNYFVQIGFTLGIIIFFIGYFAFSIQKPIKITASDKIIGCEGYISCSPLTKQSQKKNIIQKIELNSTKLFTENYSSIEYKGENFNHIYGSAFRT